MITPPTLDGLRGALRPDLTAIPEALAAWPRGEGPLADVPLLDPAEVAPTRFEELAGTVRVASATAELVTVAGLLEIGGGGLLVAAMTLNPHDLSTPPDEAASRRTLASVGARADDLPLEVAALLSPVEDGDGPAAGVGIVRPLVLADPSAFPAEDDAMTYPADLHEAAAQAVTDETEVVADLAGRPLDPLEPSLARVWGPLFSVVRAAVVGLAARGAGTARG